MGSFCAAPPATSSSSDNHKRIDARLAYIAITALTAAAKRKRRLAPAAGQPLFADRCLASTFSASKKMSSVTADSSKVSQPTTAIKNLVLSAVATENYSRYPAPIGNL
jgi:hypothetical protein